MPITENTTTDCYTFLLSTSVYAMKIRKAAVIFHSSIAFLFSFF